MMPRPRYFSREDYQRELQEEQDLMEESETVLDELLEKHSYDWDKLIEGRD